MIDDSVVVGEEFLEHYGVKGMHWGIRKHGKAKIIAGGVTAAVVTAALFPVSMPVVFAAGAVGAYTTRSLLDSRGNMSLEEIRR